MSDTSETPVDLRSDTVTRPSPAMREAMATADVGDDVYGEDPTIHRLQARAAALFGKPAGLLFPSGCMANLAAIMALAPPGTEAVTEALGHTFNYEQAAAARVAGVQIVTVPAEDGVLRADAVAAAIRPENPYLPTTSLVILENTSNMRGGRVMPLDALSELSALCRDRGLALHMDGARVMNACVASGVSPAAYGAQVDSVMFCLSKGLGAPVGSLLVGSEAVIARAHGIRKMLGGGMRQAGVLAAAGLLALEDENVAALARDHEVARALADVIAAQPGAACLAAPETNIVLWTAEGRSLADVAAGLAERGVLCHAMGEDFIRFVTHRDLPADAVDRTRVALAELLG